MKLANSMCPTRMMGEGDSFHFCRNIISQFFIKNILLLACIFFITGLFSEKAWGQISCSGEGYECKQCGNGDEANVYCGPLKDYWSYYQILYTSNELCTNGGRISSIAFQKNNKGNLLVENVRIYMANVNETVFASNTSWIPVSSLTEVYSGNITFNDGWTKINLQTEFDYVAGKSLLVAVDNFAVGTSGSSTSWGGNKFYFSTQSNNKVLYKSSGGYAYGNDINPASPGTGNLTTYRPNTAFCIKCRSCDDPGTFAFTETSGSVVLNNTLDVRTGNLTVPAIAGTITYASSNTSIATVTNSGVVHTHNVGNATITATFTPSNDDYCTKTATYTVTVTNDGCNVLGNGTSHDDNVTPIYVSQNATARFSYTQQLYTADNITDAGGAAGVVRHIKFQYYGPEDLTLPIIVYLGQTSANSLQSGWITDANLTQVYSGIVTFTPGWVDIELPSVYYWNGTSNLLLAVKTTESTVNASNKNFYYTTASNLARYTNPESEAVLNGSMCPSQGGTVTNKRPNVRFCIDPCVTPDVTLSLSSTSGSVAVGGTIDITSDITYTPGTTPGDTTLTSSVPSVASVAVSAGNVIITALQAGTTDINITFTPDDPNTYCVTTLTYTVTVTDDCTQVGSGTSAGHLAPVYSTNANYYSYTQQIYTATEIAAAGGEQGLVELIKFHYYGDAEQTAITNLPIEVYMGQTYETTLSAGVRGWITGASLTNVFSGSKTFAPGWVDIDISAAGFHWDGESNIIVALRTTAKPSAQGDFYYTEVANKAKWARSESSAIAINGAYVPTSAAGSVTNYRPEIKFCIDECTSRANTLAFSVDTIRIVSGDSFARPTLSGSSDPTGTITYTSSNTDVATITNATTGTLTLSGRYGTTVITASTPYETIGSTDYCAAFAKYVIVVSCRSAEASLNSTSESIDVGDDFDLNVATRSTGTVTWTSSNPQVASVDEDGVVTGVAEGHCVITATIASDGICCEATVSCNIHVPNDGCTRIGWATANSIGVGSYSNNSDEYSYTQQLYSATEIRMAGGVAGTINSIKIRHKGTATTVSDVYMASTLQNDLEDSYVTSGFIKVVNSTDPAGTINYVDGWTEISLTTPFEWDGESNIVVAFNNHRTALGESSGCIRHTVTWDYSYMHRYTYRLRHTSSATSIALNASNVPTASGTKVESRSDIKFCITGCTKPVDAYFSVDNLTVALDGGAVATTLTVNPDAAHGSGTVTYSSDNTTVATVASDGKITPVAEGTATIIAHVAGSGSYCSANAYLNVTVCNCKKAGDEQYAFGNQVRTEYTTAPVDNSYNYGYRQIIYSADQLMPGTINSIAFNFAYASNLTQKDNVVIYMTHTTKNSFDNNTDWILSGLTQVYSGALTCSEGWNRFDLQTPFVYNGCDNLVVAIDDNSGKYNSIGEAADRYNYKFYTSESTNNVIIYYNHDTHNADALDPREPTSPYNRLLADLVTNHYPDARFCITPRVEGTHTLTYEVSGNCGVDGEVSPSTIASVTAASAVVTSIVPSCSKYTGFMGWNTASDGSGTYYYAGDVVKLCSDVTLYARYADVVNGESSCENAVAFCNNGSITFAVSEGSGESYGDFYAFLNSPGTWWYMQVENGGNILMTIDSDAGDVDFACWGPFDNMTCDLADLSDDGANGWYSCGTAEGHESNGATLSPHASSTPIGGALSLGRPSGNLVDFGGLPNSEEYLQIINAQPGEYYMILVSNYANRPGYVTFTLDPSSTGSTSCDIVTDCDITSISASTTCTTTATYDVSGEISFRDAPVDADATLVITDGTHSHTFTPPFSSPTHYHLEGLSATALAEVHTLTATFTSATINCSKTSSYTAPTKISCGFDPLPVELLNLHATCNGKRALVSWTTASERNNDYFVVERSDDALNFVEVGRVAGAGNSIETLSYSYADYGIRTGDNYYRLVQVDYDGTRTTSEIIEVYCSGSAPEEDPDVFVYPNPFDNDLIVHLVNFNDHRATVEVIDMLGRTLFQREVYPTLNDAETTLNLSGLPAAAYYVRVSTDEFVVYRKVVKSK